MEPPFGLEQFTAVFKNYNETVFPMQIIFYLISAVAVYLVLKSNPRSDRIISIILSFFWLWMGIVYHLIFFTTINNAAYLFGFSFIVQGILFLVFGVFQNGFSFNINKDRYGIAGVSLILFALVVYPVLGYLFGHVYPSSPTFGLPCPTTIFTFGVLLLNTKKCPITILIIPIIWSIIGVMAAFQFGVLEDLALLVASLFTTFLLIYRNKLLYVKNSC